MKKTEPSPDSKEEENQAELFKSMEGLMDEKAKLELEHKKIRENKFLKLIDRNNAIKSVRSLSRTIDELISKEREKI